MGTYKDIVDFIQKGEWMVINVGADDDHPPFSYTVGLYALYEVPELFVSGYLDDGGHQLLNNIANDIKYGRMIEPKMDYHGYMHDRFIYIDFVKKEHYSTFFGMALQYYQGNHFPVYQCVWADENDYYPWQSNHQVHHDILISLDKKVIDSDKNVIWLR